MTVHASWSTFGRMARLGAIAVAGGLLMAGPAIHSELDNAGAAMLRVVVGLVVGAIGAPMFIVVAWRKPVVPAAVSMFVPPIGAAIIVSLAWSDDYSLTHLAVPLTYVTAVVTRVVVRDRAPVAGACPTCAYDLRAHADARCPECGAAPDAPGHAVARRGRRIRHGAVLLAVMGAGGVLHLLFIRGLLSLG
ncbi:MAG: hypothetical protein KDA25_07790 [Phycisphaerales bacterium]|nr:hypothetical protein [Phycisphaerales bacterium]